jgi:hypothetical protein
VLRLDPTPLLDAARNGRPWHTGTDCLACTRYTPGTDQALCVTVDELAAVLVVARRQVLRWRDHGVRIQVDSLDRLDRYATAAGTHVLILWPELAPTWGVAA